MTDEKRKTSLGPLLDGVAAQSMTAFDARLRENLIGAGVETEAEIERFKSIAQRQLKAYRRHRLEERPDVVPDDPIAMRALLEQLLALPSAPKDAFTVAFRKKSEPSESVSFEGLHRRRTKERAMDQRSDVESPNTYQRRYEAVDGCSTVISNRPASLDSISILRTNSVFVNFVCVDTQTAW